jgi:hypothetical protein
MCAGKCGVAIGDADGHNYANTLLAAGFCERWPATHEREGFAGGLRASVWLFKEKNLPLTT